MPSSPIPDAPPVPCFNGTVLTLGIKCVDGAWVGILFTPGSNPGVGAKPKKGAKAAPQQQQYQFPLKNMQSVLDNLCGCDKPATS